MSEKTLNYATPTVQMPRMCILAIISAVKSKVIDVSEANVTYCRTGSFSNVFGVLSDTDASEMSAHIRIILRTHSYRAAKRSQPQAICIL